MTANYDLSCFNVTNLRQAKDIILTKEDITTDDRWTRETPYFADLVGAQLGLQARHQVLDYGCGVGRIALELIQRHGCSVVGVDVSPSMRALAAAYVESPRFLACAPDATMDEAITPCHHVLCVWVLQHILALDEALDRVERKLQPGGRIFVVDGRKRCLPTSVGQWVDDGRSVRDAMRARFKELAVGDLDTERTSPEVARNAYWAVYQRKD